MIWSRPCGHPQPVFFIIFFKGLKKKKSLHQLRTTALQSRTLPSLQGSYVPPPPLKLWLFFLRKECWASGTWCTMDAALGPNETDTSSEAPTEFVCLSQHTGLCMYLFLSGNFIAGPNACSRHKKNRCLCMTRGEVHRET